MFPYLHQICGRDLSRLAVTTMLPLGPPSLILFYICMNISSSKDIFALFKENLDMQLDRRGGLGPGGGGRLVSPTPTWDRWRSSLHTWGGDDHPSLPGGGSDHPSIPGGGGGRLSTLMVAPRVSRGCGGALCVAQL